MLYDKPGVSIVQSKTFGANFTRSPPFWIDDTKAHKIVLMCVDTIESKYQLLNMCKLLFDLVVHQQQHIYIVSGNIPIRLAKFERNFTKHNYYFVMQFMSKHNFYFEANGVVHKKFPPLNFTLDCTCQNNLMVTMDRMLVTVFSIPYITRCVCGSSEKSLIEETCQDKT